MAEPEHIAVAPSGSPTPMPHGAAVAQARQLSVFSGLVAGGAGGALAGFAWGTAVGGPRLVRMALLATVGGLTGAALSNQPWDMPIALKTTPARLPSHGQRVEEQRAAAAPAQAL